jgi:hypothetical protein
MTELSSGLPDQELSKNDPGDDVQGRFRYQATCTAVLSLKLLDDESPVENLLCEHHEDILLKLKDGSFEGIQIKTRESGLEPFKANDDVIEKSILKFIEIEKRFPSLFSRFVLVTNHGFWKIQNDHKNLPYLIDLSAQSIQNPQLMSEPPLSTFMNSLIKKGGDSFDSKLAIVVIPKIFTQEMPKLEDIDQHLIAGLANIPSLNNRQFLELSNLGESLTDFMLKAAAFPYEKARDDYISFSSNPKLAYIAAVIQSKLVTRQILESVIAKMLQNQPTLPSRNSIPLSKFPKGYRKLQLKMGAAGISMKSIELAKDHKFHLEHLLAEWHYKYGDDAQVKYEHIRSLVNTECTEAFDSAYKTDGLFGNAMLDELRKRLRQRWILERDSLFGCEYEHLSGMASMLTEDCTVWWSDAFSIPEQK